MANAGVSGAGSGDATGIAMGVWLVFMVSLARCARTSCLEDCRSISSTRATDCASSGVSIRLAASSLMNCSCLPVPRQLAAGARGDVGDERRRGRRVTGLDRGHRVAAGADALHEVAHVMVRAVEVFLAGLDDESKQRFRLGADAAARRRAPSPCRRRTARRGRTASWRRRGTATADRRASSVAPASRTIRRRRRLARIARRLRRSTSWRAGSAPPERDVHVMHAPALDPAGAVVGEEIPVVTAQSVAVGLERRRAEPEIVVESVGHGLDRQMQRPLARSARRP